MKKERKLKTRKGDGYFTVSSLEKIDKSGKMREIGLKTIREGEERFYKLTVIENP